MGRFRNLYGNKYSVPNELFLLKRAFKRPPPPEGRPEGAAESQLFWVSKSLKTFLDRVGSFARPSVLDLGRVNGDNIAFFGSLGWRTHVHDFLGDGEEPSGESRTAPPGEPGADDAPPRSWLRTLDGLERVPSPVQGVICWDILDRMPQAWAQDLVKRLHRLLAPGGVALSFLGGRTHGQDGLYKGFRIVDRGRIELIPGAARGQERHFYQNAEIMEMFSCFSVLDFGFSKDGHREILVQKQVDPQGDASPARGL